jgi:hypothetical protein
MESTLMSRFSLRLSWASRSLYSATNSALSMAPARPLGPPQASHSTPGGARPRGRLGAAGASESGVHGLHAATAEQGVEASSPRGPESAPDAAGWTWGGDLGRCFGAGTRLLRVPLCNMLEPNPNWTGCRRGGVKEGRAVNTRRTSSCARRSAVPHSAPHSRVPSAQLLQSAGGRASWGRRPTAGAGAARAGVDRG